MSSSTITSRGMDFRVTINVHIEGEFLALFLEVMQVESMVPRAPVPPEAILDTELLNRFFTEKHALVFTFIDPSNPYKQTVMMTNDPKVEAASSRFQEFGYFHKAEDIVSLSGNLPH